MPTKKNKTVYIAEDGSEHNSFRAADFYEQRKLGVSYVPRCSFCEGDGYIYEVVDSLANLKIRKDCPYCEGTGIEKLAGDGQ